MEVAIYISSPLKVSKNAFEIVTLLLMLNMHQLTIFVGAQTAGQSRKNGTYDVCSTPICLERAKLINESLNWTVDPCDDFYSYACGGWMGRNKIPEDKASYSIYDILGDGVKGMLRDLFGNMTLDFKHPQNITQKAAVLYRSCVAVPDKNDTPEAIVQIMNASGLHDWPILSGITPHANWTDVLLKAGMFPILELNVGRDKKNLSARIIKISQITFPIVSDPNASQYDEIIEAYKKLIKVAARIMKPEINESESSKLADELVEFEKQLSNLTLFADDGDYYYEIDEDEENAEDLDRSTPTAKTV